MTISFPPAHKLFPSVSGRMSISFSPSHKPVAWFGLSFSIWSLHEVTLLSQLPRLQSLLFSDVHFLAKQNPICRLKNHEMFALYHIPNLKVSGRTLHNCSNLAFEQQSMRLSGETASLSGLFRILQVAFSCSAPIASAVILSIRCSDVECFTLYCVRNIRPRKARSPKAHLRT